MNATSATDPADALLAAWSIRAATQVRRRLRDARAHAEAGRLTDASERIGELAADLVHDVMRPARGEFYRDAFTAALLDGDPRIVDTAIRPTTEGRQAAQMAPIAGRDQAAELQAALAGAANELHLAANAESPAEWYAGWERRHGEALNGRVRSDLSDAQIALREAIGQIVIRPEFR